MMVHALARQLMGMYTEVDAYYADCVVRKSSDFQCFRIPKVIFKCGSASPHHATSYGMSLVQLVCVLPDSVNPHCTCICVLRRNTLLE